MVVEYARNVLGWEDANSTEFDETTTKKVVIFMPEIDKETMGGTMRLGARITKFTHTHNLDDDDDDDNNTSSAISILRVLYGGHDEISERHRHRYEVNPDYVDIIHNAGLKFVGRDDTTGTRMEVAELPRSQHPYYVGCQYHPEFQSRPLKPSPPFHGLVLAATGKLDAYLSEQLSTLP
jgi:CTP synthase